MHSGKKNPYFISTHKTPLTAVLSKTGTFLVESPYIDSCLNLSTTVSFFCPQDGLWGAVHLYLFYLKLASSLHPIAGGGGGNTCDDTCQSLIRIFWLHLKHGVQWRWKQFLRTFTCPCWFPCRSLNNKKIILGKKLSFFGLPFLLLSRCGHQFFSFFFSSA